MLIAKRTGQIPTRIGINPQEKVVSHLGCYSKNLSSYRSCSLGKALVRSDLGCVCLHWNTGYQWYFATNNPDFHQQLVVERSVSSDCTKYEIWVGNDQISWQHQRGIRMTFPKQVTFYGTKKNKWCFCNLQIVPFIANWCCNLGYYRDPSRLNVLFLKTTSGTHVDVKSHVGKVEGVISILEQPALITA